jgi:hypothetical protein
MSGVDAPAPWRIAFDNARDPYTARNALGAEAIGGGGGGGGGAPDNAEYIVAATDATLTAERVLTNTATITWDFTTPGQAKASTAAGGGNVSNSGTPTLGQYAKWTTATTIQGVSAATVLGDIGAQPLDADLTAIAALTGTNTIYYRSAANTWSPVVISTGLAFSGGNLTCTVSTAGSQPLDATLTALAAYNTNGLLTQTAADTFTGRTLTGPAAGITVSNGDGVAGNPTLALANDLAALEALSGTDTIYYRSGTSAWTAVTVGTGLTFTSGTLAATGGGGGGNVSNSGTPTAGQVAEWVTSTTIKGSSAIGFRAHKNGTNQSIATGIGTLTKVTFGTEVYDQGGYYDAANSRWTPPAGMVHIDIGLTSNDVTANTTMYAAIYKNGAFYLIAFIVTPNISAYSQIHLDDVANGTDYYEAFVAHNSGVTSTIDGRVERTHFCGHVVR